LAKFDPSQCSGLPLLGEKPKVILIPAVLSQQHCYVMTLDAQKFTIASQRNITKCTTAYETIFLLITDNDFRLHRMHEMQTIVTDVRSVCLSVTQLITTSLCKQQDAVWGEYSLQI